MITSALHLVCTAFKNVFTILFSYGLYHIDHSFIDEAEFLLNGIKRFLLRFPLRFLLGLLFGPLCLLLGFLLCPLRLLLKALRFLLGLCLIDTAAHGRHRIQQLAQGADDIGRAFPHLHACLSDQIGDGVRHRVQACHDRLGPRFTVAVMDLNIFPQRACLFEVVMLLTLAGLHDPQHALQLLVVTGHLLGLRAVLIVRHHEGVHQPGGVVQ